MVQLMKESPSLSLVIPTKDKLGYLSRTIPLSSKIGFDEIIVVDASTKEAKEIEALCQRYGARYVWADLDRLAARNYGACLSTTSWVAICDDDIIVHEFDLERFSSLASGLDFMFGGWGERPTEHYAWIFRREFFLNTLRGYDLDITGGDDLDITLRSKRKGEGADAFKAGIYRTETIGLDIAEDYPNKWIRNKVHYSLTILPLLLRHKALIPTIFKTDVWRFQRILRKEPAMKVLFEGFIDRAGLVYSPLYFLMARSKAKGRDRDPCDV